MPRYEWRALFATYAGGYAVAVLGALTLRFMPVIWARAVYEVVIIAAFWLLFRRQSVSPVIAGVFALACAVGTYLIGSAAARFHLGVSYLVMGTPPGDEKTLAMSAAVDGALLVALLIAWAWKDGRWKGLLWLASIEIIATLLAIWTLLTPASPLWTTSPAFAVAGSWDVAIRMTVGWAVAVAIGGAVMRRNGLDGDTEQALQPDASASVHNAGK